ncbi:MAG: PEP-CTERM sorting domain-containing protein [Akkermansia sp.]|nr:PEP-CTERM sorting domain-containing protein [Akkermansia sp.]
MKTTLITLFALAGLAAAETVEYTLSKDSTATWGDPQTLALGTGVTFNETDGVISLSYLYTTMGSGGSASVAGSWETPTSYANTYSPKVQLQSGKTDSWTLSFSVTNNGQQDITLTGFTFDGYCINGGGGDKSAAIKVSTSLTGVEDSVEVELQTGGRTGEAAFSTNILLGAGKTTTLDFTLGSAQTYNTFAGLTGGSVTYTTASASVPEPATATLSLLALAGLAARRRRK